MRLIEVADLEKFIHEHRCVIGDDNLLLVARDDGRWHEALPLVKTAYDVDNVVEELETNKQNALEVEESIKEYNVWNKAIEIVKRGGGLNDD